MDPAVIALLVIAALFAGTVDAIAGGGGLITFPALLAAGLPIHLAYGTNKGGSMWGSGGAMVAFWRAGRVDRTQARFTFPLGLLGSAAGAVLALALDESLLRPLAIVMLIGAAILLVVKKPAREDDEAVDAARARRYRILAAILALAIGAYDGFFGPGTGTFLFVGFVALCGKSTLHAAADAKVVNFASNLGAVIVFASRGAVAWEVALPMAVGQLCGGIIGARLALRGGTRLVRIMVLAVSSVLVGKLLFDLVRA
ncbi:MAG TPA: TSUP family transporter [Kofleriaceae bacterium]